MKNTNLRRAALAVAMSALSVGMVPSGAAGTSAREVRIAGGAGSGIAVSGLASGFGAVVWVESKTLRQGHAVYRLASLSGKTIRRTAWTRQLPPKLAIRRQVDEQTGRVVVRVAEVCPAPATQGATCKNVLRTPRTLERSPAVFAPVETNDSDNYPSRSTAVDGAEQVTATTIPAPTPEGGLAPTFKGSSCTVSKQDGTSLPGLADCAGAWLQLWNGLLVATWTVASQSAADGLVTTTRVSALDLRNLEAGWRTLGVGSTGDSVSKGVQASCVLADGLALVSGSTDTDLGSDPATWSISVLPLRAGGASWTAPAPQLTPPLGGDEAQIACSGSSVYALIRSYGRDLEVSRSRVVRLLAPR